MIEEYSYGVIPFYEGKNGREVLLIKNRSGGHRGFPKGHIDDGETFVEAAKRELMEETGIKNVDLDENLLFEEHYSFLRGKQTVSKHVGYYIGYVGNKKVTLQDEELFEYRRVLSPDVHELLTYDDVRVLFAKVLKYIV